MPSAGRSDLTTKYATVAPTAAQRRATRYAPAPRSSKAKAPMAKPVISPPSQRATPKPPQRPDRPFSLAILERRLTNRTRKKISSMVRGDYPPARRASTARTGDIGLAGRLLVAAEEAR